MEKGQGRRLVAERGRGWQQQQGSDNQHGTIAGKTRAKNPLSSWPSLLRNECSATNAETHVAKSFIGALRHTPGKDSTICPGTPVMRFRDIARAVFCFATASRHIVNRDKRWVGYHSAFSDMRWCRSTRVAVLQGCGSISLSGSIFLCSSGNNFWVGCKHCRHYKGGTMTSCFTLPDDFACAAAYTAYAATAASASCEELVCRHCVLGYSADT